MNSIIDELEERYEEAKKEFEAEPTDPYKQSMYVAFLQVYEIDLSCEIEPNTFKL